MFTPEQKAKAKTNMNKLRQGLMNNSFFSCSRADTTTAKTGHTILTGYSLYNVAISAIILYMILDAITEVLIGHDTVITGLLSGIVIFTAVLLGSKFIGVTVRTNTKVDSSRKLILGSKDSIQK